LEDLGVDEMIILKWILDKYTDDINWIHLAKSRSQWRALAAGTVVSKLVDAYARSEHLDG
jgi:hypothetical protein